MSYTSNKRQALAALARANRAGATAAAVVYEDAMRRALALGYTSGAFVTGANELAVRREDPVTVGGVTTVAVGSDNPVALYWEVGHYNLFTRRYEREVRWATTLLDTRDQQSDAFARAFRRSFGDAPGPRGGAGASVAARVAGSALGTSGVPVRRGGR